MSEWGTGACEECGWSGNRTHPVTGANLIGAYDGRELCATCRVDARLEDGDFA